DARLDKPDDFLVEAAGPLLAVAGDERDRVALVEQLDHALHLQLADLKVLGDAGEVRVRGGVHDGPCQIDSGGEPGATSLLYGSLTLESPPRGVKPAVARAARAPRPCA